jgi:tetratricopeptide (TPR) repeat protein
VRWLCLAALLTACAHAGSNGPARPKAAPAGLPGGVEVQDAIHGVRYLLPPGDDAWQITREGDARSASGVEAEVSSFPVAKPTTPTACREQARTRLSPHKDAAVDAPRDEAVSDAPAGWSFTSGPPSAPVRNRWAFYSRGAECLVFHVVSPVGDAFADKTFVSGAKSFQVLELSAERQREVDLLAGMGFLERRDPSSALDRFEALSAREPGLVKAHFGALMAGFEIGSEAYARALPHGLIALKSERELSPDQRQLALRAVGVMQLAQNQVKEAADTLAELVVRAPELAEAQYNYACALARLGDAQGALDHLKLAVGLDGDLVGNARDDDDLKSLRGSPRFQELLKSLPAGAAK